MPTVITMTGPGTATIVDDAAAEIALLNTMLQLQLGLLTTEITQLRLTIADVGNHAGRLADNSDFTSKSLDDHNSTWGSIATKLDALHSTIQAGVTNQVQKNNFDKEVTKQGMVNNGETPPPEPSLKEQITQTIKDASVMDQVMKAEGIVKKKITDAIEEIEHWIESTAIYQSITGWLKRQKDLLLSAIKLPSAKTLKDDTAAQVGSPSTPD